MDSIDWQTGYVQVYTGNGKGKTTAAFGLALRAAGAGLPVYIGQFMKSGNFSECTGFSRFEDLITLNQYGRGKFIMNDPEPEDIEAALKGLQDIQQVLEQGKHRLVILDEANGAVNAGLFATEDLMAIIDAKPRNVELIITGRGASEELINRADLVTEMKEIKHYYQQDVPARIGIEK